MEKIQKEKPRKINQFYTLGEEIFNSVSHGVGAALAVAALAVAVVKAAFCLDALGIVATAIYGGTLVLLYMMSTLYHAITNKRAKYVFRVFDHCTIYLLIAGTYTPIVLIALGGQLGWILFGVLWGLAAFGITMSAIFLEKFKKIAMLLYIGMGWCIVWAVKPMLAVLDPAALWLILIGGLAYTVGIIFYRLKNVRYMHSIWHLFVLAGSVIQYFAVLLYIIK